MLTIWILLVVALITSLAVAGLILYRLLQACRKWGSRQKAYQHRRARREQELSQQIHEIRHAIGIMLNNTQAVGQHLHSLNLLARHLLRHPAGPQSLPQHPPYPPQIRIELCGYSQESASCNDGATRTAFPEDMPLEMQKRIQRFESIYRTLLSSDSFPSCKTPELN